MLTVESAGLVLVDLQAKLAPAMHEKDALIENTARLVKGVTALGIPILWTEQNPAGLGPTVPEVAALLPGRPFLKFCFGCCAEPGFNDAVRALNRRQLLLAGIESHVCVYQTAAGLLEQGYEVHVVTDAVSSRTAANRALAIQAMCDLGARRTGVEMALFELLRTAKDDRFREILRIVK